VSVLGLLVATAGDAAAERLVDVSEVASGGYLAPRLSPDGNALLVTAGKLRGLELIDLDSGRVDRLSADAGAGLHARFLDGDRVFFKARRAGAERAMIATRDGSLRAATDAEIGSPIAIARAERIFVNDGSGRLRAVGSGDRFFAPVASPNGDWVAFQGLATGIYVYRRSTDELIHLGPGTAPAWSPTGDRLAFERTEDDGHEIIGSELYLYDLGQRRLSRLTATPGVIERRPSFGPAGATVAFDDDRGAVFLGRLSENN
jgi:Tol biopolymer transport system component